MVFSGVRRTTTPVVSLGFLWAPDWVIPHILCIHTWLNTENVPKKNYKHFLYFLYRERRDQSESATNSRKRQQSEGEVQDCGILLKFSQGEAQYTKRERIEFSKLARIYFDLSICESICGHLTPLCSSSLNCCHNIGNTKLYRIFVYTRSKKQCPCAQSKVSSMKTCCGG